MAIITWERGGASGHWASGQLASWSVGQFVGWPVISWSVGTIAIIIMCERVQGVGCQAEGCQAEGCQAEGCQAGDPPHRARARALQGLLQYHRELRRAEGRVATLGVLVVAAAAAAAAAIAVSLLLRGAVASARAR